MTTTTTTTSLTDVEDVKDLEELLNIIKNKRGFDDTQMAIYMRERNLIF